MPHKTQVDVLVLRQHHQVVAVLVHLLADDRQTSAFQILLGELQHFLFLTRRAVDVDEFFDQVFQPVRLDLNWINIRISQFSIPLYL